MTGYLLVFFFADGKSMVRYFFVSFKSGIGVADLFEKFLKMGCVQACTGQQGVDLLFKHFMVWHKRSIQARKPYDSEKVVIVMV